MLSEKREYLINQLLNEGEHSIYLDLDIKS